jgi:nucleoside 2-deoxyribosyltransferase
MKIYFSCSSGEMSEHLADYNHIRESILSQGHTIVADWIDRSFNRTQPKKLSEFEQKSIKDEGIEAINQSDFVIADVSFSSSSVGYQIGYALSRKIPVLCIYSEEFGSKKAPQVILAIKSPLLVIKSYNTNTISELINTFSKNVPLSNLIKFNFITTPEISKYLSWAANKNNISKSEFLRSIVEKTMKGDIHYRE